MTSPSSDSASVPAPAPRRKHRHLALKIILPVIVALIVGFALWAWATLGYVYARGERTGHVQKLAQVGWLCKTWEGDMATLPVAGAPSQTFDFTIRDDSVARALELVGGKQVTLSYAQHKGVPGSCFGETEYYIDGFRPSGPQ